MAPQTGVPVLKHDGIYHSYSLQSYTSNNIKYVNYRTVVYHFP